MDDAERAVAGVRAVHDDAEAVDVGQLLQRDLPVLHLAPDRERLLLAPIDLRGQSGLRQLALQRRADLLDQARVALADLLELVDDGLVGNWVAPPEGQLLELLA